MFTRQATFRRCFCCISTGLRLSLNIQYDEYVGLFAQDVGVRVSVHPFNVTPFPESDGINAAPGAMTEIGVTLVCTCFVVSPVLV